MCETVWRPNLGPEELFECISQALLNAVDRDASSGWGAIVHIIEPHQVSYSNESYDYYHLLTMRLLF